MLPKRYADLEQDARQAAEYAIHRCAQHLLTVDVVAEYVCSVWDTQPRDQHEPTLELLRRTALSYCSRHLYVSCCSLNPLERDCAFDNLRRYLHQSLSHSTYARSLTEHAAEDLLQQTLTELHDLFTRRPSCGPDDPAAFLKWAQTILYHNAYTFLDRAKREAAISLEAQSEQYLAHNAIDEHSDQIEEVFTKELQRLLVHAIHSLKNPRYRLVLVELFLKGIEESELALAMGAQVRDIYLWRHRALKALRGKQEVLATLQPWLLSS